VHQDSDRNFRIFRDRHEAGRLLGAELERTYEGADAVVLGLPRGGVPVAFEVAQRLGAPLDVLVVRKLGAPFNPELAIGAIARGGVRVVDSDSIAYLDIEPDAIERILFREQTELERRERLYRAGKPPLDLRGKTAILVDDGIATGSTMEAAVLAARAGGAAKVVAAAPTASRDACVMLRRSADAVEVLAIPEPYIAVGAWYAAFPQLEDEEVIELLARCDASPQRAGE